MKYGEISLGQIEAAINKLGGIEGFNKLLRGELIISENHKKYREENFLLYFKVTSDGTTGQQWIERLEKKGFKLSKWAKDKLLSKDFKATTGITYEIAVLKDYLFKDTSRITKKILTEDAKRKLVTPNTEATCLIIEEFSDDEIKAMGPKWVVAFHKPIKDSGGNFDILNTVCDGGNWLNTFYDIAGSELE